MNLCICYGLVPPLQRRSTICVFSKSVKLPQKDPFPTCVGIYTIFEGALQISQRRSTRCVFFDAEKPLEKVSNVCKEIHDFHRSAPDLTEKFGRRISRRQRSF